MGLTIAYPMVAVRRSAPPDKFAQGYDGPTLRSRNALMARNLSILISLVVAQLVIGLVLEVTPPLVDWSWQVRLTVAILFYVAGGAAASTCFLGSSWQRIG